ncbi:MAG: hypothetical protein QM754_09265 [Tepidisphaeraceae bacterium]
MRPLVKENGPALNLILASAAAMPQTPENEEGFALRMAVLRGQSELAAIICETLPADAPAEDPRVRALTAFATNWCTDAAKAVAKWRDASRPTPAVSRGPQPQPPKTLTGEALWTRAPLGKWRDSLRGGLRATVDRNLVAVAMYLDNIDAAMKVLADIAKAYPVPDDVVGDAVVIWAKQHQTVRVDPLTFTTTYLPAGIPLTRAAQDRNIDGLVAILTRVKEIYGRPLPAEQLPEIFDLVYSQAEVYSRTDLERVFGPLDKLDTPLLLKVCNQMFGNLQNDWLFSSVQSASGTGRTENETYEMVLDGYEALVGVLADRGKVDRDAAIYRNLADVEFEYADTLLGLNKGYGPYNKHRAAAFDALHQAMTLSGGDTNETPQTLVKWFYRAMGGEKLNGISSRSVFSDEELGRIKSTLNTMPPRQAMASREALLEAIRSQLSLIKADVRYRVVNTVLDIVGDHPNARSLQSLTRYYGDLLQDIKFVSHVDGTPQIGTEPFGLTLSLRHTNRIERQTRGFAKYVQNQFKNSYKNPNYMVGHPGTTANYRDDLEKNIRNAVGNAYNVVSIVWSPSDVKSIDTEAPGWRKTPLCYVVLKAKDASADRLAPVQIDLDFADQLNEVVLPIRSAELVVSGNKTDPRPMSGVSIEQTVNDHDARQGKLELTINAAGTGLMPSLDRLVDLSSLPGMRVANVQDTGPLADSYEARDGGDGAPQVASRRKWQVNLETVSGGAVPADFVFPAVAATAGQADVKYRRYADADIVDATSHILLNGGAAANGTSAWPWVLGGGVLAVLAGVWVAMKLRGRPLAVDAVAETKPLELDPFRLLARLHTISRTPGDLSSDQRGQLAGDIGQLERHYFGGRTNGSSGVPDVASIAGRWN